MTYEEWMGYRTKANDMFGGLGMPCDRATYDHEVQLGLKGMGERFVEQSMKHGYTVTVAGGQVVLEKVEPMGEADEAAT
jgi:hypothetical protein